jgi:Protein O-mannosyl-transferase TMEM260-like
LFFSAFGLYLATLAPSVTFWDSGELITAACTLGIPHQPGYPLYCITGNLFQLVPFGNAAYRLNLQSAFYSALAVFVVYRAILAVMSADGEGSKARSFSQTLYAAALSFMLAVSGIFWSQSIVAEVYAAGALFVALLLYLHALAAEKKIAAMRYVALSGFLFGLGVVNHISLALYAPALIISWAMVAGRGIGFRGYACAVFFAALGLSVNLYLPVRSLAGPAINIGHPDTWPGFLWTVKWAEYADSLGALVLSAITLAGQEAGSWRVMAALAALACAAWLLVRERPKMNLPPVVFLVVYMAVISAQVLGSARDARFGLPPKFFIPALTVGVVLAGSLARPLFDASRQGVARYARAAIAALFITAALFTAYKNLYREDMSENFIAYDYAENSLKSAGQDGVLLTWGDNGAFPLWYIRTVECYRDDVVLVHTPLMTYGWYLDDVKAWAGVDPDFMEPYYLGENAYRLYKAVRGRRSFAYDYSTVRYLKLDEKTLALRGLVYFEGVPPKGDPWPWYVFRGVTDPTVLKGPMEENIIEIYRYQARLSARFPAGLFTRPQHRTEDRVRPGE